MCHRNTPYPKEAVELALFITSTREQVYRYKDQLYIPTIPKLLENSLLCDKNASVGRIVNTTWEDSDPDSVLNSGKRYISRRNSEHISSWKRKPHAFRLSNEVQKEIEICDLEELPIPEPRPSTQFAPFYAETSSVMFNTINAMLIGRLSPESAVEAISCGIHIIVYGKEFVDAGNNTKEIQWNKQLESKYPLKCPCKYLYVHNVPGFFYPNRCSTISEHTISAGLLAFFITLTVLVGIFLFWIASHLSRIYRHRLLKFSQQKAKHALTADPSDILVSCL